MKRSAPSTRHASLGLSLALAACAMLHSARGRAETPCPVTLTSGESESAWARAARDLERQLRDMPRGGCADIEIRVDHDSARLTYTTTDGRRAIRSLEGPADLEPTIEALQITLEPVTTGSPPAAPKPESPPVDRLPVADARAVRSGPAGVVGVAGGARIAGPVSPLLAAFGALHGGQWEFGVLAQWELGYNGLRKGDGPEWTAVALSAGLLLARRQQVTPSLDLVLGANILGAMVHEETRHVHPNVESTQAAARVGAYAGFVWPRPSAIRMRGQLAIDFQPVPASQGSAGADMPALSTLAGGLSLGIEVGEGH